MIATQFCPSASRPTTISVETVAVDVAHRGVRAAAERVVGAPRHLDPAARGHILLRDPTTSVAESRESHHVFFHRRWTGVAVDLELLVDMAAVAVVAGPDDEIPACGAAAGH